MADVESIFKSRLGHANSIIFSLMVLLILEENQVSRATTELVYYFKLVNYFINAL